MHQGRDTVGDSGRVTPLERVEAGLRQAAAFGRDVERVGGFVVAVAPGAAAGLAVAVPEQPDVDLGRALALVERAFERRSARPVIEYVEELHPDVADAAHARGWSTAARAALMTLAAPASMLPAEHALSGDVRWLEADDDVGLRAYLAGQHAAYGFEGDALAWLPLLRAGLAAKRTRVAAFEVDGRLVAGAGLQFAAGVAEVVGVWTLPQERRRGFAQAVCSALLFDAFEHGLELAWLSAAAEATSLYGRLGFVQVGHQRNLEGPLVRG